MKIFLIAPTEIPARRANTLQVMKMVQALAGLGHHIHLAAPSGGTTARPNWETLTQHYGLQQSAEILQQVPLVWLPAHPRLRRYDYGLRAVLRARQAGAELVYTRLPQAAAIASELGQATILEIHDLPQGRSGPWLFRRFLAGKGARRLVVITQALANDLGQRFALPQTAGFTVIAPDGVDLERYQNLPAPQAARQALIDAAAPGIDNRLEPQRFTAGYTGHLYPGRGTELLLELAAGLPGICFLIAGGEPQDIARFQAQADARGLKNLLLTGFIPNARLPAYQAACDALLMPYQQRVAASSGGDIARYLSPMKLFEYLACGRPVLSSDLPVLQEVLNPQNAILLPANEPQAWRAALRRLQADPATGTPLALQARQDARQYTWQARAERILEGLPAGNF